MRQGAVCPSRNRLKTLQGVRVSVSIHSLATCFRPSVLRLSRPTPGELAALVDAAPSVSRIASRRGYRRTQTLLRIGQPRLT